jgi:hypothetical protein
MQGRASQHLESLYWTPQIMGGYELDVREYDLFTVIAIIDNNRTEPVMHKEL